MFLWDAMKVGEDNLATTVASWASGCGMPAKAPHSMFFTACLIHDAFIQQATRNNVAAISY